MNGQLFLNYTHGTTLQAVCELLLSADEKEQTNQTCSQWIAAEKRNLLKKQPKLWDIPISTREYFNYLVKIEKLLQEETEPNSEIIELLQEIREKTREKVHALFLTQEPSCWPSLESVFRAAEKMDEYSATLVYTPFYHVNFVEQIDYYDEYQEKGIPVVRHYEYDLPQDSPDVVFMIKPYGNTPEQFQFKELECVIPRAVYIPYGMESTVDLAKTGYQFYLLYKCWRHCAYGEIVKSYSKEYGYRNGENVVVWGHPKADNYRDLDEARKKIPEEWVHFINGRKTILWTPHHLIDLDSNGTGTWLIWGEQILELAFSNPDIAFIIRPHPLMEGAIVNSGAMSRKKFDAMKERIASSSNIIWDDSPDYRMAIYASDAIITDGTTFCIEYLYTKKPIMLTPRNMKGFYQYENMLNDYYIGRTLQDIERYIDLIRTEKDPLRERRLKLYNETFYIPENCTVGENIMTQVKNDLTNESRSVLFNSELVEDKNSFEACSEDQDSAEFPLLSILVVCYKNTSLLNGMLDSIFSQDYPRIQLIVSDDCSEDFDPEQVLMYINQHRRNNIKDVIVRKNEQNMRTVRHIHDALELATGDYIIFTAADDRFYGNDACSCYIEQFLEHEEAVWLVARCNLTTPDYKNVKYASPTAIDEPFFLENDSKRLFSRWSRRSMALPCSMAFKKAAFELVGGIDLNYQFIEDWPLELKLLRAGYAPIYYPKVTAIHNTGGITNSNDRYGKEVRKAFFEDKWRLFRTEVDPYKELLTAEDLKCYKQYLREFMDRHYFVFIDWPDTSKLEKIKLFIKKPIAMWWMFELWYQNNIKHFERKKALLTSQIILMFSLLSFYFGQRVTFKSFFISIGFIQMAAGLVVILVSLLSYPLEKYFQYKRKLRGTLVN